MEIFKEANGQWSFIRVLAAGGFVLYAVMSLQNGEFIDLSGTQLGALLFPIAGKVLQKFAEGKPADIDSREIARAIASHIKIKASK